MSKFAHALVFCRLFFINNFPCQLGRGHSLFIYFYACTEFKKCNEVFDSASQALRALNFTYIYLKGLICMRY